MALVMATVLSPPPLLPLPKRTAAGKCSLIWICLHVLQLSCSTRPCLDSLFEKPGCPAGPALRACVQRVRLHDVKGNRCSELDVDQTRLRGP